MGEKGNKRKVLMERREEGRKSLNSRQIMLMIHNETNRGFDQQLPVQLTD